MSFSSAQWTIPELCVRIATCSKTALNSLPPVVKRSLMNAEMIHPGSYAARDEVIEAAQNGRNTVTGAGIANHHGSTPERSALPVAFWKNAEIKDSTAGWMVDFAPRLVAERVDQPGKQYDDLLVDSLDESTTRPVAMHMSASLMVTRRAGVVVALSASESKAHRTARPSPCLVGWRPASPERFQGFR